MFCTGKEIYPPHKSSNISGKVVYDNSPDPEVKYVSLAKKFSKKVLGEMLLKYISDSIYLY